VTELSTLDKLPDDTGIAVSDEGEHPTGAAGAATDLLRADHKHRPLLWEAAQIGYGLQTPAPTRQPSIVSGKIRRGAEVERQCVYGDARGTYDGMWVMTV
jgi:hypothetical protein